MLKEFKTSILITIILLLIVSGLYPFLVWAVSQAAFHNQANDSLVRNAQGKVVGSALLAQSFTKPQYFQSRPSAAGNGYDPTLSGGTNLGPTSSKLIDGIQAPNLPNGQPNPSDFAGVKQLAAAYRQENGMPANALVPVDAVTRSASGLDPDISILNAEDQAPRVAKARGMSLAAVQSIIDHVKQGRQLGFLGQPRVNVLKLNLALERNS